MPNKKNDEKRKTVVYLGPVITGVAMPGTVYRNGLTPQLEAAVKELPALGRLLAKTGSVAQLRKELKDPQSAASICYQKAAEYAREKGAKV
ncbi:MAG: hypothetical protein HDR71_15375 [Lachnospiraceae bacterium]|nr:hypothetical protein [Lachnospiraceae bacterium]